MISVLNTVLHLTLIIGIAWWICRRLPIADHTFWPALVLKLGAGIALGLLYTFYYPVADTFAYFNDGSKLAEIARESFASYLRLLFMNDGADGLDLAMLEPRALFLTKVTSILSLLTFDNYWAISLYYSGISFLAAWYLVTVIHRFIRCASSAAVVAFLFMPSVVFWTSGLLKESLAMAAFFFLSAVFLKIWFHKPIGWWQILLAMLGLWVFWNLKYYYAGVFAAVAVTTLIFRAVIPARINQSAGIQAVVWVAILSMPVVAVSFLHPNFNLDRISAVIVSNNQAYNVLSDAGEYVRFESLTEEPLDLLLNAPLALFSGLFRPFIWETSSLPQLLQGVENAMLLMLFVAAMFTCGKYARSPHRLLILSAVAFIVLTAVFITMSSPNFGTLSRYRVGYISFFAFIVLCENPLLSYLQRYVPRLSRLDRKS